MATLSVVSVTRNGRLESRPVPEEHPDFKRTARLQRAGASEKESLTLVWWMHNCCSSVMHDAQLDEAAGCAREHAAEGAAERSLLQWIKEDELDSARFARRKRAA